MQTDVLIVGQGICGTFLSRELERAGLSFVVIDEERPASASRAAAGLINPVTGRRLVKTWMIDQLLPFAVEAYGGCFLKPGSVVDFFPTPQMRLAFLDRYAEDTAYLRLPSDEHDWDERFSYELGYGVIEPCYLVDIHGLLGSARRRMAAAGTLRPERFELAGLVVGKEHVWYGDIKARWVIFCDGVESFMHPYFSRLPFAPNKGEALIVELDGFGTRGVVFKKGMSLTPWRDGLYWVGSSYEWSFSDPGPTAMFRQRAEGLLKEWLRVPFRVVGHLASVRPATLERRPFVGLHPVYPAVGILNGMGTKGCSLAPFFARQLTDLLVFGKAIQADADVGRFRKVLGKG